MFRLGLARRFSAAAHAKVCIIGGGPGGISAAAHLVRVGAVEGAQISIIDGSTIHHYKPGWTLYSNEDLPKKQLTKPMEKMMPRGVRWIDHYVKSVEPGQNSITLQNGDRITYENLIIASGLQFNFGQIKGLQEALANPERFVCSVYDRFSHEKMRTARHTQFSNAIFTQAQDPINCAGAPQKVLYLTIEAWKKRGFKPEVSFYQARDAIFGSKFYAQEMEKLAKSKGIHHFLGHKLVEVRPDNVAVFEVMFGPNQGQKVEKAFDYLHAVPPMSGLSYLKDSGLVNGSCFVEVDSNFRSTHYPNVWSIGDGSNIPTSKTESAVLEQACLLAQHLDNAINKKNHSVKAYSGYSACPLLVGGKKIMMAEFGWGGKIEPTFFMDQRKPRYFFYLLKRYLFPFANNYLMPRGLWRGRKTLFDPSGYDYTEYEKSEIAKNEPIAKQHQ